MFALLTLLIGLAVASWSHAVEVPALTDLRADLAEVRQRGIPLLVLFHTPGCSYCHYVMEDHLRPMILSGQYVRRALIRQLEVGGNAELVDADGRTVKAAVLARRMKVHFFPTVLFLGPDGQVLGEPLVGVANTDLYGTQLEFALQRAEARLK